MSRPVPNTGILDIAPYTPGKSPVPEPGRKMFKLSANETPFGPSPKAIEAFKSAADHLEDYPEGTSKVLRDAIGRALRARPRPHHLRRRLRRNSQSARAHTYLKRGRRSDFNCTYGFLVYPIATMACGAKNVIAARDRTSPADVDAILKAGHTADQAGLAWPIRTIRPEPTFRLTRSGGCAPACRRMWCWCWTRPMRTTSRSNDYEFGIELVATTENTVMSPTPSRRSTAWRRCASAGCSDLPTSSTQ